MLVREAEQERAGEPLSPARVKARGLEVHYAQARITLPDLTLDADRELALVGPSGSGKTTLLHVLAGLLEPTRGDVEVAGESLTRMPQRRLERFRARTIGVVFQDLHLIDGYTALENVVVALAAAGVPLGEARGRARDLLSTLDLAHRLNHLPQTPLHGRAAARGDCAGDGREPRPPFGRRAHREPRPRAGRGSARPLASGGAAL